MTNKPIDETTYTEQLEQRITQLQTKSDNLESHSTTMIKLAETVLHDRDFCQRKALELDKLAGERRTHLRMEGER